MRISDWSSDVCSSDLERLVGHHVAPVAGRVADRQQDRDVALAGRRERLLTPGVPIDRVVGVLSQVRAGLVREAVGTGPRSTVPTLDGAGGGCRLQGNMWRWGTGRRRVGKEGGST